MLILIAKILMRKWFPIHKLFKKMCLTGSIFLCVLTHFGTTVQHHGKGHLGHSKGVPNLRTDLRTDGQTNPVIEMLDAQWFQSGSKRTKHLLPVRHIFLNNFRLKKKFFITHFKIRINIFELCWKLFIFYTSWQANSTESFFSLFLCQIINPDVIPHRLICHTIYFI